MKFIKSIGWFGFSADPPTIAHQNLVQTSLQFVDAVVVFPAGTLPYKQLHASKHHRLAMTKLWQHEAQFEKVAISAVSSFASSEGGRGANDAAGRNPWKRVIVSDFDIWRKSSFQWYPLWKTINSLLPDIKHYFIVGSDQYEQIGKTWFQGKKLLKEAEFLVFERDTISSSKVRKGDLDQIDPKVRAYLQKHHLYASKKNR